MVLLIADRDIRVITAEDGELVPPVPAGDRHVGRRAHAVHLSRR
ncbi:MAG TPA: hypothetical protein VGP30_02335 [Candidatus Limnocylindrales bacterium]|nr:hypothetical protein [Candidatus Limnocylindrales bacterium]